MTRPLVLLGALVPMALAASPAMMNMATITDLQVACDKTGMSVTIDFSQPFNGIIYSKGFYSDDRCRYVSKNSRQSAHSFWISSSSMCGSKMRQLPGDNSRTQLSNTIIIQNDEAIQEIWDVARTISCDWVDNFVKTVNFNPFTVGMLQEEEVSFQGDQPVECWMDLKFGKWPEISNINSIVRIGDPLSLLVYARDNNFEYDISVKDCYAFAGPDYENPNTQRLQLTDKNGCVLKDKLISSFKSARENDNSGSIIVTYAHVQAFKFPDVMDVFMTCNIEICKGDCDDTCSTQPATTTIATTTEGPRRYGSTLFGEPIYTTKPTPVCLPNSVDPKCRTFETKCTPGSSDPECYPTDTKTGKQLFPEDKKCLPGSSDPKCFAASTSTEAPSKITRRPRCRSGSKHPDCSKKCHPHSTDPRCHPKVPPRKLRCFKGSKNPRCNRTTHRPRCFKGSRDSRCPQLTTVKPITRKTITSTTTIVAVTRHSTVPTVAPTKHATIPTVAPIKHATVPTVAPIKHATVPTVAPSTTEAPTTPKCSPDSLDPECETATKNGRWGSILFPATITTLPTTTTTEQITTTTPLIPSTSEATLETSPVTRRTPTTTQKSRGSIIFGEPVTTKKPIQKPRLKSKTTTKSLARGKQISEPKSEPEPVWQGDPRHHAFHSYHFQKGDGRRSRNFGRRINSASSRKTRSLGDIQARRPLKDKKPIKLSRSLYVVSSMDFSTPQIDEIIIENQEEIVCLSSSYLLALSTLFSLIVLLLVLFVFLYIRIKRRKL